MVEVSRNLVAVLLILVIVVSGFGAWSMFSRTAPASDAQAGSTGDATAAVVLSVTPRAPVDAAVTLKIGRPANG